MRYAVLLRAINVGGRKVRMKELREALMKAGYGAVQTLQAAGSVVMEAGKTADPKLESIVENIVEATFDLRSDVMARSAAEWAAILKANPFPTKAKDDPTHLVCMVCKDEPDTGLIAAYLRGFREKHDRGEQLEVVGRQIYIDFGMSIGESKLSLPKTACIGTGRNWNTMLKIGDMLQA